MNQNKVFLTGAVINQGISQLEEIELAKQKLEAAGFKVTTPLDDLPRGDEFNNKDSQDEWIQKRRRLAAEADIIVFMPNHEQDVLSLADVRKARNDGHKMVKSIVDFLKQYVKINTEKQDVPAA